MKFVVSAALAAVAAAHPTFDAAEFNAIGRSPANAEVHFAVALPNQNVEELERIALDLSNPDSVNYGKWMDHDEVNALIAPLPEHREEVHEWATSTGAKCEHLPSSLRCTASVAEVEKLLNTEFTAYEHVPKGNRVIHRISPDTEYSSPTHLEGKMSFMTNMIEFPTVRARMGHFTSFEERKGRSLQNVNWAAVLETLQDVYDIPTNPTGSAKATGSTMEFEGEPSFQNSDTALFAAANGVPAWNATQIIGPFQNGTADAESSLDWQFMGGIVALTAGSSGGVPANKQIFWTTDGWIYDWTQTVASTPNTQLPQIFSMSYGWAEDNQCYLNPPGTNPCTTSNNAYGYVAASNAGLAAMAARGLTVVVASGDSGAHGRTDPSCSAGLLNPVFPGASPWVTTVGATMFMNGNAITAPRTPYCQNPAGNPPCASSGIEMVSSTANGSLIVSGGGFSNVAATPIWQQAAVSKYLKSGAVFATSAQFNATGRGYPDVAALGHNYMVYMYGSPGAVDGTSASTPVWSGLISLLNAQRLNAGKSTLGFINPLLYKLAASNPNVFTDITIGNNMCTEQGCGTCTTGYGATTGWDATTGLGTPVFSELQKAIAALA